MCRMYRQKTNIATGHKNINPDSGCTLNTDSARILGNSANLHLTRPCLLFQRYRKRCVDNRTLLRDQDRYADATSHQRSNPSMQIMYSFIHQNFIHFRKNGGNVRFFKIVRSISVFRAFLQLQRF